MHVRKTLFLAVFAYWKTSIFAGYVCKPITDPLPWKTEKKNCAFA